MNPDTWVHELSPAPDPATCCERLAGLPCRVFLDSALAANRLGRYSFLSANPIALIRAKGAHNEYVDLLSGTVTPISDPIAEARALLAGHARQALEGLPPFQGGVAGFVSYDWGHMLEHVPRPRHDDLALPDLAWGVYDWVIAWDHQQSRAWIISTGLGGQDAAARGADVLARLHGHGGPAFAAVQAMAIPCRGGDAPTFAVDEPAWHALGVRSSFTRDGYLAAVGRVREYIYAGDIYQANLSQRFTATLEADAWTLYRHLRERNPAPFAAFLDFPDVAIVSASPERFLQVDPGGHVETRPIKGTRPRGAGPTEDAALAHALEASAKDRAEHVMIVDLMRNDLSRVCRAGTVSVPEMFTLERYATVQHLVSTVVGDLAPGEDAGTLLKAAFPGGSITGAPKIRVMEVIAGLEPSERGIYCGSIGYWSVTGAMDSSIAIRTGAVKDGRVHFGAGGGVVADSAPDQEYRETLDKARGIIDALAAARAVTAR